MSSMMAWASAFGSPMEIPPAPAAWLTESWFLAQIAPTKILVAVTPGAITTVVPSDPLVTVVGPPAPTAPGVEPAAVLPPVPTTAPAPDPALVGPPTVAPPPAAVPGTAPVGAESSSPDVV